VTRQRQRQGVQQCTPKWLVVTVHKRTKSLASALRVAQGKRGKVFVVADKPYFAPWQIKRVR